MRFAALFALPLVLSACASAREKCVADATKDLRATQARIAQSRAIIERGYALETRTRPQLTLGYCGGGRGLHACYRNTWHSYKKRVPADIEAELAKLAVLERRAAEQSSAAQPRLAACAALPAR